MRLASRNDISTISRGTPRRSLRDRLVLQRHPAREGLRHSGPPTSQQCRDSGGQERQSEERERTRRGERAARGTAARPAQGGRLTLVGADTVHGRNGRRELGRGGGRLQPAQVQRRRVDGTLLRLLRIVQMMRRMKSSLARKDGEQEGQGHGNASGVAHVPGGHHSDQDAEREGGPWRRWRGNWRSRNDRNGPRGNRVEFGCRQARGRHLRMGLDRRRRPDHEQEEPDRAARQHPHASPSLLASHGPHDSERIQGSQASRAGSPRRTRGISVRSRT